MSLNNEQMLPSRVRKMRQMEDLLNAEDIILAEIERMIEAMYQEAALLHEELINEAWLKEKLEEQTGAEVSVAADADRLLASFILNVSEVYSVNLADARQFIEKWLPAHLAYELNFLMEGGFSCPERISLSVMALGFESQFWPVRTLNGTWLLDGSYPLDAVRKLDECGLSYEIGETALFESFLAGCCLQAEISQAEMMAENEMMLGFESQFWMVPTLNGVWSLDGSVLLEILKQSQGYGQVFGVGKVKSPEGMQFCVRLDKDLWFLDGSEKLNGRRILDAVRREEELV